MRIVIVTTDNREHFKDYDNPSPYFGTAPAALLEGFARLADLEVHVVSCAARPMRSPAKLFENVWFHSLHVPRIGWMRTAYLGCIRAVRKKLRQIQPHLVHGQGTERDCAISAVCSGFPNVLTLHGNMRFIAEVNRVKPFSFIWLAARLERVTVPRSSGVICITQYTQQAVADIARRTWLVPNAVDASFFEVDPNPAEGVIRILCVGLVCVRKNQNAFIRALDPLARQRKFEVVFLGHAPPGNAYAEEFVQLVKERQWCVHAGFADREKLKEHFREATMVALPSLEDNCPMVVLEAMAAGVPVVAAKVGGVPDLIEDGKTGFFCDPLDPESLRNAVSRLLDNLPAARALAANARQSARERFHPQIIARRHEQIYRELLSTRS